jgi:alpha-beta hydrolase superfamily lysophospholipase
MLESHPARRRVRVPVAAAALTVAVMFGTGWAGSGTPGSQAETTVTVTIRGKQQTVRTFGTRGKQAVVVSSSDGGWVRLAPLIAGVLAGHGFFVVGFDSKAYLSAFTEKNSTLTAADVPGDYAALVGFAAAGSPAAPILVGVSEGAGLSVLAATRDDVKRKVQGVVVVGLPDKTELGWRWRDSVIYLTHGVPNEPTFDTGSLLDRVAPVPLAVIHSSSDPFVSLETIRAMMARAKDPKRLWTITSSDHRFSDNETEFKTRLLEAVAWVATQKPSGE